MCGYSRGGFHPDNIFLNATSRQTRPDRRRVGVGFRVSVDRAIDIFDNLLHFEIFEEKGHNCACHQARYCDW